MSELVEYKPGTAFPGVIGQTVAESSSARLEPVQSWGAHGRRLVCSR
jgi:hypothetical protein